MENCNAIHIFFLRTSILYVLTWHFQQYATLMLHTFRSAMAKPYGQLTSTVICWIGNFRLSIEVGK